MADTNAFENLADDYDAFRPDYPSEIMEALRKFTVSENVAGRHIIDVGAGTGISTREMAAAFGPRYFVTGLESCLPMLRKAALHPKACDTIAYVVSAAENLPIGDASVCLVATAQAIQWFDRPIFYREAARILQPGGVLAIMQNNRDWQNNPFLEAYEEFLETSGDNYNRFYRSFDVVKELAGIERFTRAERVTTSWNRPMTVDDFIGMSFSSSKTKSIVQQFGKNRVRQELMNLAAKYQSVDGRLTISYTTELYMVRRNF